MNTSSSSSSSSRTTISALLEKTTHYDKDERYMATSDLCEILKRGLDEQQQQQHHASSSSTTTTLVAAQQEKEICRAVLQLLHDASHDVQAVAVKTLGVLLQTVHTEQVLEIADSLTDQVLDAKKGKLRDVYTIGLRTTVKQTSSTSAVANRLLSPGRLLSGISSGVEEIALACLDVLGDLLAAAQLHPPSYPPEHYQDVRDLCLSELTHSDSPVLRKRAGNALAGLAVLLPDELLHTLIDELLATTTTTTTSTSTTTTSPTTTTNTMIFVHARIRTLCAIAGAVSTRLVPTKMGDIIPLFLQYTSSAADSATTANDDDNNDHHQDVSNELREACFMGLESFVRGPPSPDHQAAILQAALRFLKYDPNYVYDDDDDDANMDAAAAGGGEEEEDGGDDDDDEMQEDEDTGDEYDDDDGDDEEDDDDDSWKVRRSAIRVLKAIIDYERPPTALWEQGVGRSLVQRFKEREENCRVGVLECYTQLLTITLKHCKDTCASESTTSSSSKDSNSMMDQLAKDYTNDVVKAAQKILATKLGTNDRSKSKTLALLSILCQVPGGMGPQLPSIMQHVQKLLADPEGTNKALRLDGLSLVVAVLASDTHDAAVIRSVLLDGGLLPQLCRSLQEQWYKNIAEALKALVYVPSYFKDDPDSAVVISRQMYGPILPLLAAHDVDQEIKECALKAAAALLVVRQLEPDQAGKLLSLLLDRLKNETTRIVAIKTVSFIANNSDCDLGPILMEAVLTMASFMEYTSRSLKQAALEALAVVVQKHGAAVTNDDGLFAKIVVYVVSLFNDRDLHLCHLSLRVVTAVLDFHPSLESNAQARLHSSLIDHALEPSLVMATSSLLRDQALDSLLSFFRQLVEKKVMTFQDLFAALDGRLGPKTAKVGVYNLSKCMSAVITSATESEQSQTLDEIFARLGGAETPTKDLELRRVQLAVLMTGDLGRSLALGQQVADKLKAIYEGYFASSSEDLRSAVAYALGNASVGSPSAFLPMIVSRLGDDNKRLQFLLLSALREFIQCNAKSGTDMTAQMAILVPPLEEHCSDHEEGVRSLVAECLGSLAVAHPDAVLPKLSELQKNHCIITITNGVIDEGNDASMKNSNICSTIASSVKHAIAGQVDQSRLAPFMPTFAELIQQEDLRVRNASLLMLYSAFHHMPNVVSQLAAKESIMPFLYNVAELKAERKVDLGPFTHTVDDALPLRKSALSIFATCLESNPDVLDMPSLMAVLARSLADKEDIQLHAHQIIMSMGAQHSYHLSASLNSFVEPLEKTMHKKAGSKTGTELERLNDLIKSSLRVVITLGAMEGANGSTKFMDLVQRVKGNSKFASLLEAIESENYGTFDPTQNHFMGRERSL